LRKLRKRLEESESEIEKIEAEILALDIIMEQPGSAAEEMQDFYTKYQLLKEKHNEEMNRWAQYTHEVEVFLKQNE
jgi:hypothetical protein